MRNVNWGSVEENQEFEKLGPGGYVCGIVKVEDVEEKEYLKVYYDIVLGKHKDYYKNLEKSKSFWGGTFIRSYKQTAEAFFKGFLTAIEKSNKGFEANRFDGDIKKLQYRYIGLVLGEEEYVNNDGELKTRLYVANVRSIDSIKNNDFKVPELKKLKPLSVNANAFSSNDDNTEGILNACPF